MSLKDKASLIFKPSRYKAGTAYSFRGTDFTFTRASTATRVNASGLIEDVASGVPRLNYDPTDLTKDPVLLLEPSRTNKQTQSENINTTNYSGTSGVTIISNSDISPDGTSTADKIVPTAVNEYHKVNTILATVNGYDIISCFVKSSGYNHVQLTSWANPTDFVNFDLSDGTVGTVSVATIYGIQSYGNGWYRIWANVQASGSGNVGIQVVTSKTAGWAQQFVGDGSSGILLWGVQIEASSNYPSSYIRTSGSAVTRSAEAASNSSASSVIGQSQGTIFIDFVFNGKSDSLADNFNLALGTWASNIIVIGNYNSALYARIYESTVLYFNQDFGTMTAGGRYKCAIAYASNDAVFYVNGKLIAADSSVNVPATSTISLNRSSLESSKDVNEVLLFKSRLSNDELASLTSFDDYEELVDAKGLTWESPTITNNRLTALAEL